MAGRSTGSCSNRGGGGAAPGADFYSRWIDPPDDARLPLHGLLPQRLRDESVSGEPWVRGAFGQLPDGNYVWPALSRTERWRPTRWRRVQGYCGGGKISAELAECGCEENRAVGRILRRLPNRDGAGA